MSELEQLKSRIALAGKKGVPTAQVRDDYEPVGARVIRDLVSSGEYVTRKVSTDVRGAVTAWKIYLKTYDPYK